MGKHFNSPIFFATMDDGIRVVLSKVKAVKIHPEAEFILHRGVKRPHVWTVTEVETGCRVATGKTSRGAVELARQRVKQCVGPAGSIRPFLDRVLSRVSHRVAA